MAFSTKQLAIIERLLPLERVDEGATQSIPLRLTVRELRFLLEAIDHYRDTRCTVEGLGSDCELMFWYENAQGHIERACEHFCEHLIERLLSQLPEK